MYARLHSQSVPITDDKCMIDLVFVTAPSKIQLVTLQVDKLACIVLFLHPSLTKPSRL